MSTQPATIVQRLWNYGNVLRDEGVSSDGNSSVRYSGDAQVVRGAVGGAGSE
jgi:hypothetical protein